MTCLTASGVFAAFFALGLPAAAGANNFKFGPASGGTKATFTVQFTASLSERGTADNPQDFYIVDISGPQGCREVHAYTTANVTAGQLVTIRVSPYGIVPFGKARQWCVGRYSGSVHFCYCGPNDPTPNVPVGRFGFAIRGPANYAGRTSQGKSIRFTLSATDTRITGLTYGARLRCRGGGRSFTDSGTAYQLPHTTITFRNGTFRVNQIGSVQGVRQHFEQYGRLAGGTFQGNLRFRESGRGVSCDSGSVTWSAQ